MLDPCAGPALGFWKSLQHHQTQRALVSVPAHTPGPVHQRRDGGWRSVTHGPTFAQTGAVGLNHLHVGVAGGLESGQFLPHPENLGAGWERIPWDSG